MTTTTHADIKALLEDVLPILKDRKEHLERLVGQPIDTAGGRRGNGEKLANVNLVAERVIAMIGTLYLPEPVMPALLLDCPRAADADAHLSAPTIPFAFARRTFNVHETDLKEVVYGAKPSWLKEMHLAAGSEERGRLLTFTLTSEEESRCLWVRA